MKRYSDDFSVHLRGDVRVGTEKRGVLCQTGEHRSPKSRIGSRSSAQRPGFKKRPRRNNKP